MTKPIYRSGIIPYYFDSMGQLFMLFMKPSDPKFGGPEFQISKGKQEENETAFEAAIREGSEELGLKVSNIEQVYPVGTCLGRTEVFLARIKDSTEFSAPHYETGETQWMTPEQFKLVGRDIHRPVVRIAVEILQANGELPGS